jgi:hypothetical protein
VKVYVHVSVVEYEGINHISIHEKLGEAQASAREHIQGSYGPDQTSYVVEYELGSGDINCETALYSYKQKIEVEVKEGFVK